MIPELTVSGVEVYSSSGSLFVRIDAGSASGLAETVDEPEVRAAIQEEAGRVIGTSVFASNARWVARPRVDGARWIAHSVLDNALVDLASTAAGLSIHEWLGGRARARAAEHSNLELVGAGVAVLELGGRHFDSVVSVLTGPRPHVLVVDLRRWGVSATTRLDAVCRVLQIGIGLDVRNGGNGTRNLASEVAAALPMATLGLIGEARAAGGKPEIAAPIMTIGAVRQ